MVSLHKDIYYGLAKRIVIYRLVILLAYQPLLVINAETVLVSSCILLVDFCLYICEGGRLHFYGSWFCTGIYLNFGVESFRKFSISSGLVFLNKPFKLFT